MIGNREAKRLQTMRPGQPDRMTGNPADTEKRP